MTDQLSMVLAGASALIERGCELTSTQQETVTRAIESAADPAWLATPSSEIEWDFRRYHDANPGVYRRLESAAIGWASTSPKRVGVKRLAEDLRYQSIEIASTPHAPFKINNNHVALYARLLIHRRPELKSVIELRVRKETGASV